MKRKPTQVKFFSKIGFFGLSVCPLPNIAGNEAVGLVGMPGSGKTALATAILLRMKRKHKSIIFSNDDYVNDFCDYSLKPDYLGKFNFPPNSVVFIDEMSLNGYDCRNTKNFADQDKLDFWKKHRQEGLVDDLHSTGVPILWTNQAYSETDIKIRDFLTTKVYLCRNCGFYVRGTLIHKDERINEQTGRIDYQFYTESFLYSLFHRGERIYTIPKVVGKHYRTAHPTSKLSLDEALQKKYITPNIHP